MSMKPQETIALAKLIAKKPSEAARAELTPGTYTVDFTVRVTGKLDVGEDVEYTPTISMSPLMLAALAARHLYSRFGFKGFARASFVVLLLPYAVAALAAAVNNVVIMLL